MSLPQMPMQSAKEVQSTPPKKRKITRSPPIGWARQNAAPLKFDPKPSNAAFLGLFSDERCRSEVTGDVISGMAIGEAGMDIRAKFGDSELNVGQIIRVFGQPHPFCAPSTSWSLVM